MVWLATHRFHANEKLMDVVNIWLHNLAVPVLRQGTTKTSVTVRQVP
jgi:hypothetical protein